MTTSAVDRVRNIPLIVEQEVMAVDGEDNSGFPFDRDLDRDDSLRSQLDDIAKRHPEFAEHFESFPFRSDSLGRRSRPPRPSDESEFRRFAGRPFGSGRFERFGFPFASRDLFEDEFQRPEEHRAQPSSTSEHPQQPQQQEEEVVAQPEEKKGHERGRRQNIQQSNTVDLGQKQEPVNDRNQRSMSAPPPDNRTGQQRFVSSINIPINRDGGMGDMGAQQSQSSQHQDNKPANKPTERVIPIHVEGRDEPVMPKHTGPSFAQSPQPERIFTQSPQPERIFGHRPSQFTQFVGREPPRQYASGPEWHHPAYAKPQEASSAEAMRQQQQQQQQQHKFQQQQQVPPQKSQEQVPSPPPAPPQPQSQPQPQPQPQQQQQQHPPQQHQQPNPIDLIQSIQKDVSELMGQVEKFNGVPKDKQYLYLDEMLTRNLIKLDNIDTQGQENIRQARKEAIKCIERCIGILEAKAAANVPQQPSEEVTEEKMEVETKKSGEEEQQEQSSQTVVDEQQKPEESSSVVEEKMEVEVSKENEKVNETKAEETGEGKKEDDKIEEKVVEQQQQQQPPVEEKMEVVSEPVISPEQQQEPPKPNIEEMSSESSQIQEAVENKTGEAEMASVPEEVKQEDGEAAKEASQEEDKKEESNSEDKKEKKKGKKKVVKK